MCTDLCSRHLLGHPIEPHKVMRAVASGAPKQLDALMGVFSCSSCGLCEMFSCGQGLSPRSIIGEVKDQLRKNGVTPPKGIEPKPIDSDIDYRHVPMSKLTARMGLKKYDTPAPLVDVEITANSLKVMLAQGPALRQSPLRLQGQGSEEVNDNRYYVILSSVKKRALRKNFS